MKKWDFNSGWTCRPLSRPGDAVPVTLPHDAMRTEKRIPDSIGEGNIGFFEGGDYVYRKVFALPEEAKGPIRAIFSSLSESGRSPSFFRRTRDSLAAFRFR